MASLAEVGARERARGDRAAFWECYLNNPNEVQRSDANIAPS
jgi:hypothetical protein